MDAQEAHDWGWKFGTAIARCCLFHESLIAVKREAKESLFYGLITQEMWKEEDDEAYENLVDSFYEGVDNSIESYFEDNPPINISSL